MEWNFSPCWHFSSPLPSCHQLVLCTMFFYLHYGLYPGWPATALWRSLIFRWNCIPPTFHHTCWKVVKTSQIENVLACIVLNRNPVVTSILLRFVFVSLGFYHVFTNMLRIHLFFSWYGNQNTAALWNLSNCSWTHDYKHVGEKTLLVCFFPSEDEPWETSMIHSEVYTSMLCHTRTKGPDTLSRNWGFGGGEGRGEKREKKREKEEISKMEIWKVIEKNGFLRFCFMM